MAPPHGIQLAVHIISSSYGDLCSKVCDCLLRRGTLTLAQLIRFVELSRENVINCLRVLIHQNCVQAFAIQQEGAFGEAPKIITQYMALFDNMIHKLRSPKFMQIVLQELDKYCLEIFQGLIQHGRLSINQIIDRSEQTPGSSDVCVVRENFNRLRDARFVERCPAPEPFLAPEEETPAKKRGTKSAKLSEERQTIEQRALAAAAPMESMRFLMDDHLVENGEEKPNSVAVGEKRKQDVFKSGENILDAHKKMEVLWRVNFEEFVCRMKHKACISHVKTKINNEAGIVLSAMLESSRRSETRHRAERSVCVSLNAIYEEVIKKDEGLGMDLERIRSSLDLLGCQEISTGINESYRIDLKDILEMAQNEEVESVVLKRYGEEAYRIFRLLSKAGRVLETDKISDATFIEKKDTLKILYRLWKDDFLHMEKVMTTAVRQPFLLWRVNKQPLREKFLDELYHAALNLRLRSMHEQDQGKEIAQLPKEKLVGEQEKRFEKYRKVLILLQSSLMNLDDAILLFHDF